MFKMIETLNRHVVKSFDIYDLFKFITENRKDFEYEFLIGYTPITKDEFLKYFLLESGSYQDYLKLYEILKDTKTIMYYG